MEQTILWDMMGIKHDVQEFEDIFHQKYEAKANMKDIHAHSRPKDYCEFHSTVKQNLQLKGAYHCALDDAMYLAKVFVNGYILGEEADVK